MTRILAALLTPLLISGCAASAQDQEATASHNAERTVASQRELPVSSDKSGNAFVEVNDEKIGVDFDEAKPDGLTPTIVVIEELDWYGKTVSRSEEVWNLPTEWLTGE